MALMIGVASILPFIEHACEMAGEKAHHKKCCCIQAKAATGHKDHLDRKHASEQVHSHSSSHDATPIIHDLQLHDSNHTEHQKTACDHQDDGPGLIDDCCSWQAIGFAGSAIKATKATFSISFFSSLPAPLQVGTVDTPLAALNRPPPLPLPPNLSTPSRQILFASFLI